MKYLVKFFVITIIAFACTSLYAQNVYFIDMEKIINESSAGKYAKESIQNTYNENIQSFKDAEKKLKKKETDLLNKKKMLKKEEYQKLTNELRNEAKQYQNQRRMKLEKITRLKTMARTKILEALTPILSDYSTKNNVNLIIDKKSVVMGKTELDLTTKVLEELNKKLPKIDLNAQ